MKKERPPHAECQLAGVASTALFARYSELAEYECTCLLLTLQSGMSPAHSNLETHLARLIVLLGLAGKISESEFLCSVLSKTPAIEEERRAIQERTLAHAARRIEDVLSVVGLGEPLGRHAPHDPVQASADRPDTQATD